MTDFFSAYKNTIAGLKTVKKFIVKIEFQRVVNSFNLIKAIHERYKKKAFISNINHVFQKFLLKLLEIEKVKDF